MSLKARIEAVIYAAEDPVSLAQLASLFRDEALASRAARLAPVADPEAPVESAIPEGQAERQAPHAEREDLDGCAVPEPAATESLSPETPPIPSAQEEPPPAAADPIAELAASPVTDSFPDGAPPASSESPSEAREAPDADRGGTDEQERKAQIAQRAAVRDEIRRLVDELIADYAVSDRGIEIREVAGGFRISTRAEYHDAVRAFVKSLKPPMKLSLQALETLAVIAYKQPVTAPEIGEIRGVDSGGVLGSLVARKLITTAGRKQVIGRPILYKTTREFLLRFGLKDLNELPSIEEFEKMAADLEEEASPADAEGDSPSAQDLPFAQNEIAAVEESAESAPSAESEETNREAPLAEGEAPEDLQP